MNIEQIKKDREQGIMICRATYDKLVEASLMMQRALDDASRYDFDPLDAKQVLEKVKAL